MFIDFEIPKTDIVEGNLEEQVYQIVEKSFKKTDDGTYSKWDIHDIKEEDDKFIVVLKVSTKEELNASVETVSEQNCLDQECECHNSEETSPEEKPFEKSVAYGGPWENNKFELDIAQICAFFEVVQFCDYMVKRTQMVTPVAARSLQECQKFVIENLTEFTPEQIQEHQGDPNKPLEIKIKSDFSVHLKQWQEESVEIFEKLMEEMKKKPQIVQANMIPGNFDPKGPGGLRV